MKIGCHHPARLIPMLLSFCMLLALGTRTTLGTNITSFKSGPWTNPASWTPAQVPGPDDDVTIAGGHTNVIMDALARTVGSLTIQNGGMLTHASNSTTAAGEAYKINLTITNFLTLDAGGQINADGTGYGPNYGPGSPNGGSGAGHGGVGGVRAYGVIGWTYGSITSPTNIGSGGNNPGQYGGGAVRLTVGGATTLNGTISVNGRAPSAFYNAGSGGSVFLTTGTLTGNGSILAKGTDVQQGSGGGGRIAVILTASSDFGTILMQAFAGAASAGIPGATGTLYLEHTGHTPGQGKLIIDNNKVIISSEVCNTLQNGRAAASNTFSEIILTNCGVFAVNSNNVLTLPETTTIRGDPSNRNDGIYLRGGTLNLPAGFTTYSNYFIGISGSNASFNVTELTVKSNEILRINAPFTLPGSLTIERGGLMDHATNVLYEDYKIDLTVLGNLTIQTGGQINVEGLGYKDANGPGRPIFGNTGGSHGGAGGRRYANGTNGPAYGSLTSPTNIGSGGSYGGAYGGGAVRLTVTGTTTVNGVISADANKQLYTGAGGSVFLTTGSLEGNGIIRASSPSTSWSLGGGGRVAVILTNGNDFGSVMIGAAPGKGDSSSYSFGGAGTVYLQSMAQGSGNGSLWINATNLVNANATAIGSKVTNARVGSVIITNGAVLLLESNQTLTVNGSWLNASRPVNGSVTNWTLSFTSAPNSTVTFAGVNDTTISGTNFFFNFTCTNAPKTVEFAAGSSNIVLGQLALGGGATFKSTLDGSPWFLKLAADGTQQIGIVRIRDSNAGSGQRLIAPRQSSDLGNNINWQFINPSGALILIR